MSRRAVFLDRDGTLIEQREYLTDASQVKLLPRTAAALKRLQDRGYLLVVVTNQSAVARGLLTEKELVRIQDHLQDVLYRAGVRLDGMYYCPYHPQAVLAEYRRDSDRRKPRPGMLLQAAEDLDIDLSRSWMVGDDDRDVEAGRAAGCRTVRLADQEGAPGGNGGARPDFTAGDLQDAADTIIRHQDVHPARLFDTGHLKDDLKGRAVRGGAVTLTSQAIKFALQLASTMILARLLTPADYGLVAMVAVVIVFAEMFKDMGLTLATIQRSEITHDQVSALFWVNVAVNALIAVLLCSLAPAVAWFYAEPRLAPIMVATASTFLISGFGIQHQALLRRSMRYMAQEGILVAAFLLAIVAAIIAARLGAGYWALVIMQIARPVAATILAWLVYPWRPGRFRRGAGIRPLLAFGGNVTGFNVINYFSRNADNILIGKVWGSNALGLYSKAYSLLLQPLHQIRAPLSAVAIPALSRLQDDPARFRRAFLKILQVQLLPLPLFAVLIVGHDWVVHVILGPQWSAAAPIFAWLSVIGAIQVLLMSNGLLFIPQNRSRELFYWGIFIALLSVASFLIGLQWGPVGVAAAYSLANLAIGVPLLIYYVGRRGAVSSRDYLFGLLPFFLVLVFNIAVLFSLRVLLGGESHPLYGLLGLFGVSVLVTVATYALLPATRRAVLQALRLLRHLKRRTD
jgi:PST family polysaccharide transporter